MREFSRAGLLQARIEDITRACGLSKGAFYLHFPSKEALFDEVLARLTARLDEVQAAREAEFAQLLPRGGAPSPDALWEFEVRHDRALLELFWDERLVFDVLLRGCAGTRFEGLVWDFVGREAQRVATEVRGLQALGIFRADVPAELVASMLLGTWLLVARQMSVATQKPDLAPWVGALFRLLREGGAPRPASPPPLDAVAAVAAPTRSRR